MEFLQNIEHFVTVVLLRNIFTDTSRLCKNV